MVSVMVMVRVMVIIFDVISLLDWGSNASGETFNAKMGTHFWPIMAVVMVDVCRSGTRAKREYYLCCPSLTLQPSGHLSKPSSRKVDLEAVLFASVRLCVRSRPEGRQPKEHVICRGFRLWASPNKHFWAL